MNRTTTRREKRLTKREKRAEQGTRRGTVDWYARGAEFVAVYPDHIPTPSEFVRTVAQVYGAEFEALSEAERRAVGLRLADGFADAWELRSGERVR